MEQVYKTLEILTEEKSHLQKSIPKKIAAYPHFPYPVKVLILHDQDSNDCMALKKQLQHLAGNTEVPYLIRISCRELENWYLGDFHAIEAAYPAVKAASYKHKAKFRNVDLVGGTDEFEKVIGQFSKLESARLIGAQIDVEKNTSTSFQQFVSGLAKLLHDNFPKEE